MKHFKKAMPDYQAQLSKHRHDVSRNFKFTSSVGHILPLWFDLALPGDKYRLSSSVFLRTQPLVSAAMADIEYEVHYFFVPMDMIDNSFGSRMYSTNDPINSQITVKGVNDPFTLIDIDSFIKVFNQGDYSDLLWTDNSLNPLDSESELEPSKFESLGKSFLRLAMHLGYSPLHFFADMTELGAASRKFFPYALCAYHAIYYNYFRISDREDNLPILYNVNNLPSLITGTDVGSLDPQEFFQSFFALHYVPRYNDYFLANMPAPIANFTSLQGSDSLMTDFMGVNGQSNPNISFDPYKSAFTESTPVNTFDISTRDSIAAYFALDKLARITGRAEKDYDAQVLAHFGAKVPHDVKHQITHIGADRGKIHIGEVISTANTGSDGSPLGEIAGKGYAKSASDDAHEFTAPVHGVVMALYFARPHTAMIQGFDRINAISSPYDIYQPEFDSLGFQPVFGYELFAENMSSGQYAKIFNWQYRYQQFKRKNDILSIAFRSGGDFGSYNNYSSWTLNHQPFDRVSPSSSYSADDLQCYLVRPDDLDDIMVATFDHGLYKDSFLEHPERSFFTDPFIVDSQINAYKLSVISETGDLPFDSVF